MALGKLDTHTKKNEVGPLSHTTHNNNSKMGQRLKWKTWNYRTPRRKHKGKKLDMRLDNGVFWIRHQNTATKAKTNKMKRQPVEWEKIFASHPSHKGLTSKIHKELLQLYSRKPIQLKIGQKTSIST